MITVGLHIYAAIEQVRGVCVGGDSYRIATALCGVNATGARSKVKVVLIHFSALQVYHGEIPFLAVADKQAPYYRFAMIVVVVIMIIVVVVVIVSHAIIVVIMVIVSAGLGKLNRVDVVAEGDYPGFVRAGIVQQLFQPFGFESQSNRQHGVSVRNHCDITSAGYQVVRIGAGRQ